jgi:hypothetical protein
MTGMLIILTGGITLCLAFIFMLVYAVGTLQNQVAGMKYQIEELSRSYMEVFLEEADDC